MKTIAWIFFFIIILLSIVVLQKLPSEDSVQDDYNVTVHCIIER